MQIVLEKLYEFVSFLQWKYYSLFLPEFDNMKQNECLIKILM